MPFHSMIYLGAKPDREGRRRYLVYHTGPDADGPGEIRRPTVDELRHFPDPDWRPLAGQSPLPRRLPLEHSQENLMKLLRVLLLLMLAAPGLSQSEGRALFFAEFESHVRRGRQAFGLAECLERGGARVPRLPHQRPGAVLPATGERPRIRRARAASAAPAHPAGKHTRVEARPADQHPPRPARPVHGIAERTLEMHSPADPSLLPRLARWNAVRRSSGAEFAATGAHLPAHVRRATTAGTARTWMSPSRIAACTWWRRCTASCAPTPS